MRTRQGHGLNRNSPLEISSPIGYGFNGFGRAEDRPALSDCRWKTRCEVSLIEKAGEHPTARKSGEESPNTKGRDAA